MFYIEAIPFVTDIKLENSEPLTGFKDFKRYRKVNGDHYITFYIFKDNTNSAAFDLLIEESIVSDGENEYRIKNCENSVTKGGIPFKFVNATHTFFDLRDEKYVYDSVTNTQSLQQIASLIFKDTKYTPVVLADVPSRVFESFGDGNAIALLNKALNAFGVEFEVSGTQVIFKNQIGTKGDFQLRRKHNIKNIKETRDTFGLSTYIKGFGKDGLTTEYTSPMAAVFGKRHAQPVRDERFEIKENLLEEMKKRLQDTPIITIEIDFVDLKKLGYLYDTISLGDSVFVIHEVLGIDYEARIVEYIDFPYEQTKGSSVVISNIRKDFTSSMADMQSTKTTVDDLIANGIPNKMLNESIVRASKAINDSMTELEYPESGGIIARSKVNPNHVVRMTSAGIGVSSDGGKTYKTAMTGEGLVAELIRGGLITGSTLRTDNSANYVHIQKQFIRLMESNLVRVYLGYYTNSVN
ncbi:hypothetical protein CON34_06015, partial [Bacillus thuringiensis]|uniref:phage tail protein n=1 Tax=Bacillus thuringiensis TaxID=1428 RepID=UPI000BEE3510